MQKNTKEDSKELEEKLKYIGLNLEKIPKCFENNEKIKYRPLKTYEDNNYKVYKYVDIKEIEIYITPVDRLESLNEKLKTAMPISYYMSLNGEENLEEYTTFLNMINHLNIDKIKDIEEEQKALNEQIPYEIKYKNNYTWQIYYSDVEDKYFMLYSSNENNSEYLFYLIKRKIEAQRARKKELIYVPISHMEYSNKLLKKSEIADLENYLWLFTKEWPNIYEVYNINDEISLEILGTTTVFDGVKSIYKITLKDKEEAGKVFKLIKALFILESNEEYEYNFKTLINEKGSLDFCYNMQKITYENLSEFIRKEVEVKQDKIHELYEKNIMLAENLELLKETVKKHNEEYLLKEKQITQFLECKRTFFGRVKYFFGKGKKIKKEEILDTKDEKSIEIAELETIEKKDFYTIEDLLKICEILKNQEVKYKNSEMDIKALENKKQNLEKKIQNATLYINEIESHKKSIFDFWKFTNKDEINMLTEAEVAESPKGKLKKVFNYKEDLEDFGKYIDSKQREILSKNECDAVFACLNDLDTFNILGKEKVLKREENKIQKKLEEFKEEYIENIDTITEKDFDIFGNVAQDKTKIKVLNNNKHREIEKDKYKILNINPEITLEEYKDNIDNYRKLLKEAYGKVVSPYDMHIYMINSGELNEKSLNIMNINPKEELLKIKNETETNIYKINIKENMPIIFYSNIMYYDNLNKTLPLGMDISTKVLIDLNKFEIKLVARKDFNVNVLKDEFTSEIKLIHVYEYDLEIKKESKQ